MKIKQMLDIAKQNEIIDLKIGTEINNKFEEAIYSDKPRDLIYEIKPILVKIPLRIRHSEFVIKIPKGILTDKFINQRTHKITIPKGRFEKYGMRLSVNNDDSDHTTLICKLVSGGSWFYLNVGEIFRFYIKDIQADYDANVSDEITVNLICNDDGRTIDEKNQTVKIILPAEPPIEPINNLFPLDFKVNTVGVHGDLSPVMYIEDLVNAHTFEWKIVNVSNEDLIINLQSYEQEPSAVNYNFVLKFRASTLSDAFKKNFSNDKLRVEGDGVSALWKAKIIHNSKSREDIIYLIAVKDKDALGDKVLLSANTGYINFIVEEVTANPVGGSRNTNIEFIYNKVFNSISNTHPLSGYRMQHLGIVNHDGLADIPVRFQVLGVNTILNDAVSNNSLKFTIKNIGDKDIKFTQDSKFELVIPSCNNNDKDEYALANINNLTSADYVWSTENGNNWEIVGSPSAVGNAKYVVWTIKSKSDYIFKTNFVIKFEIKDLKSNQPLGISNISWRYYSVLGYWDGALTTPIEKSGVYEQDKQVGIFTNNPSATLDVNGNINSKGSITLDKDLAIKDSATIGQNLRVKDSIIVDKKLTIKDSINDQYGELLPHGTICLWYGSSNSIPTGWYMCDGRNGTPDLRDRFVVGAGSAYSKGTKGGSKSITLSMNNIPEHKHPMPYRIDSSGTGNSTNDQIYDVKHEVGKSVKDTGNAGQQNPTAIDIRPPYYALFYIMKR